MSAFLDTINECRDQQARGETPFYLGAVGMNKMYWDLDLAALAELHALECMANDYQCYNTGRIKRRYSFTD